MIISILNFDALSPRCISVPLRIIPPVVVAWFYNFGGVAFFRTGETGREDNYCQKTEYKFLHQQSDFENTSFNSLHANVVQKRIEGCNILGAF